MHPPLFVFDRFSHLHCAEHLNVLILEDGMADQETKGETQGEGKPAKAADGGVKVQSNTPENADHELNPSAPGETGTTPGTNG